MPQVIPFPQLFLLKTFVSRWCYSASHLIISYQMKDDKLEPLKVIYIIFCLDTVQINFFFLLLFRYNFKSKTAAERHKGMFHRRQKDKANTPIIFKCDVCGALYQSLSTLNHHKKTKNHPKRSRKGEAASTQKTTSSKKMKTKQQTINDLLRNVQTDAVNDDEDEEEGDCAAPKCVVRDGEEISINCQLDIVRYLHTLVPRCLCQPWDFG